MLKCAVRWPTPATSAPGLGRPTRTSAPGLTSWKPACSTVPVTASTRAREVARRFGLGFVFPLAWSARISARMSAQLRRARLVAPLPAASLTLAAQMSGATRRGELPEGAVTIGCWCAACRRTVRWRPRRRVRNIRSPRAAPKRLAPEGAVRNPWRRTGVDARHSKPLRHWTRGGADLLSI